MEGYNNSYINPSAEPSPVKEPKKRSDRRLYWGAKYFTFKRYYKWYFGGLKFARLEDRELAHLCREHATPLLRKLKDVDMYLQYNKITNLKLAAEKINGVTLHQGETFSFWRMIGKPTKRKGYLEGMVLRNGTFRGGTGGGLCQMSNLIYWLTIHTPLTVVERHRHSYDVFPDSNRTQPFGSGATCFYNYGDLMIRNDTANVYRLSLTVGEEMLSGSWHCDVPQNVTYEVYEKEHVMQREYWGGYTRHNLLFRKVFDLSGRQVGDEYVVENHAVMMYNPLLES